MLLALDSSVGSSAAVLDLDGAVLAERSIIDTRRHAEVVGELIVQCLAEAGLDAREVTAVAVGMGPGPFTGLRVGIAAANAFALGLGIPALRVVSHDAVALARLDDAEGVEGGGVHGGGADGGGVAPEARRLLVTTDARRRERYFSAYAGLDAHGVPVRTLGPEVGTDQAIEGVTSEHGYARVDADHVEASALGRLALRIRKHGAKFAGPEPLYLRSPDVTVAAGRKRVST